MKMGPMRFELTTFRLSVERSNQTELRAQKYVSNFSPLMFKKQSTSLAGKLPAAQAR